MLNFAQARPSENIHDVHTCNCQYRDSIVTVKVPTLWPWNVLTGLSEPSLQTWINLSVEQDAKQLLFCQSTSSVGALWKANCCFTSPLPTSHTTAVLSTPPVTMQPPLLLNLRAKMGPEWRTKVAFSSPSVDHSLATPSYEPVASMLPSDCMWVGICVHACIILQQLVILKRGALLMS